jgi:hypothetical protein
MTSSRRRYRVEQHPPGSRRYVVVACSGNVVEVGFIEEALDCVMLAAEHEFGVRVIFVAPALMRIDGFEYRWPDA